MQNYGKGYFILKTGSTSFLTGQNHYAIVDLSDRENTTVENIALDGTLHGKIKGVRVNPVITIYNPGENLQTLLTSKVNTIVNLTPYNDNTAFNFDCLVVSAEPEFIENSALNNIVITLKSKGYVTFTPKT